MKGIDNTVRNNSEKRPLTPVEKLLVAMVMIGLSATIIEIATADQSVHRHLQQGWCIEPLVPSQHTPQLNLLFQCSDLADVQKLRRDTMYFAKLIRLAQDQSPAEH